MITITFCTQLILAFDEVGKYILVHSIHKSQLFKIFAQYAEQQIFAILQTLTAFFNAKNSCMTWIGKELLFFIPVIYSHMIDDVTDFFMFFELFHNFIICIVALADCHQMTCPTLKNMRFWQKNFLPKDGLKIWVRLRAPGPTLYGLGQQ